MNEVIATASDTLLDVKISFTRRDEDGNNTEDSVVIDPSAAEGLLGQLATVCSEIRERSPFQIACAFVGVLRDASPGGRVLLHNELREFARKSCDTEAAEMAYLLARFIMEKTL